MSEHLHPIDIILAKRDGKELSGEQIENFIADVVSGEVTDARLAAFLMAVFQRGLTRTELAYLTSAMRFSGEVFDAAISRGTNVDKHSTGGIGDKTSLLLAPIAAAAGLCVPMISGRSLGHSGGTLDKLETIPGYNTQLTMEQFGEVIRKAGCSIIGQTERLVPADRILYAMRDHTGTVESPYLICASIMSKKLAAGLNALVLDVKTGSGAFMKKVEDAEFLASLLVSTGELAGTRTGALLTTVDQPLGRFSGNWVEVWECVDIMKGIRHPFSEDLIELTIGLAGQMLFLGGKADSAEEGERLSKELLNNGKAWEHWLRMVEAHGGDVRIFDDPAAFHKPAATRTLTAKRSGYLASMDCTQVGWAIQRLGAGRERPGDPVSADAGLTMHAKLGDYLKEGDPLVTIFAASSSKIDEPAEMLLETMEISDAKPQVRPLILKPISAADVK
ncbi:thymidine phosphorylase [Terriglobus albidus]|uniref:thymidine phosphorylase n=1 Tax=Terriglobus albidus TaxID=1592106 RepID=UPI0021E0C9C5|nr:thymidine phosphorylase [Terriglobus albidus]